MPAQGTTEYESIGNNAQIEETDELGKITSSGDRASIGSGGVDAAFEEKFWDGEIEGDEQIAAAGALVVGKQTYKQAQAAEDNNQARNQENILYAAQVDKATKSDLAIQEANLNASAAAQDAASKDLYAVRRSVETSALTGQQIQGNIDLALQQGKDQKAVATISGDKNIAQQRVASDANKEVARTNAKGGVDVAKENRQAAQNVAGTNKASAIGVADRQARSEDKRTEATERASNYGSDNTKESSIYASDASKESSKYATDASVTNTGRTAQASEYGADRSVDVAALNAGSQNYAADRTVDVANSQAGSQKYTADQSRIASMYGADQTLAASNYAADAGIRNTAMTGYQTRQNMRLEDNLLGRRNARQNARSRSMARSF